MRVSSVTSWVDAQTWNWSNQNQSLFALSLINNSSCLRKTKSVSIHVVITKLHISEVNLPLSYFWKLLSVTVVTLTVVYLMLASLFLLSEASDSASRQSCRSAGDLPALLCLLSMPFSTSQLIAHMHTATITGTSKAHETHTNSRKLRQTRAELHGGQWRT